MFVHIISRKTAKDIGASWYFTGNPCKHGHIAQRYVKSCACMICKDEIDEKRRKEGKYAEYRASRRNERAGYQRRWVMENRDRHNEYRRGWCRENIEKVKAYNTARRMAEREALSDHSAHISQWVESEEKVCFYCDDACGDSYHVDHMYPISKGGDNTVSNMVIACPSCNLSKGDRDPVEFIDKSIKENWND